jgi:hypothetical protein
VLHHRALNLYAPTDSAGPLWNILSCSRTMIHTLLLPFPLDHRSCHCLWNMHFPCLRSLSLSACETEGTDFIDFILTHNDTIEKLEIGSKESGRYPLNFNDLSLTRLGLDSLPHLHLFKGSTSSIKIMAQAGMICLQNTLQYLAIEPTKMVQSIWEVRRMFDAILSSCTSGPQCSGSEPALGRLSALKEFDLNLSRWEAGGRSNLIEVIG